MPSYSARSREVLDTCHLDLVRLFKRVLERYDHKILRGIRTLEEQLEYRRIGWSKTLNSRHLPGGGIWKGEVIDPDGLSFAVDLEPYPKPKRNEQYYHFGGFVLATAREMGIDIRWGGDWDRDNDLFDQTFFDLVHFELKT